MAVSETDYDTFKDAARQQSRSTAQLIREAMAYYRRHVLESHPPLRELPVLLGHRPRGPLPSREQLYDDIFGSDR